MPNDKQITFTRSEAKFLDAIKYECTCSWIVFVSRHSNAIDAVDMLVLHLADHAL